MVAPVSIGAVPADKLGALDGAHPLAQAANVHTNTMQYGCIAAMRVDRNDVSTRAWPRMIMVWRQSGIVDQRTTVPHRSEGRQETNGAVAVPCADALKGSIAGARIAPAWRVQGSAEIFPRPRRRQRPISLAMPPAHQERIRKSADHRAVGIALAQLPVGV